MELGKQSREEKKNCSYLDIVKIALDPAPHAVLDTNKELCQKKKCIFLNSASNNLDSDRLDPPPLDNVQIKADFFYKIASLSQKALTVQEKMQFYEGWL